MNKYLNHLIAAEITFKYTNPEYSDRKQIALITPYKIKDGKTRYYWDVGPSRCTSYTNNIVVLHNYGVPQEENDDWWDNVDLHFLTTYYPAKSVEPQPDTNGSWLGWIAPNGDYYVSHYGDHDSTARSIMATLYGKVISGYKAREKLLETWVCLNNTFVLGRDDYDTNRYDITIAQTKTIDKINELSGIDFSYRNRTIVNE